MQYVTYVQTHKLSIPPATRAASVYLGHTFTDMVKSGNFGQRVNSDIRLQTEPSYQDFHCLLS